MYRVTNGTTKKTLDFAVAKEALDYAEQTIGCRRAILVEVLGNTETVLGELKYEIMESEREFSKGFFTPRKAHRIKALRDFGSVKAGDLGGWVETEDNLSHEGLCWLFGAAAALEEGRVKQDAMLFDNAKVFGKGEVYEHAIIRDTSYVAGNGKVGGGAIVKGGSAIEDISLVCGIAQLTGASIIGDAILTEGFYDGPCRISYTDSVAVFKVTLPEFAVVTVHPGYNQGRVVQVGEKIIGDPEAFCKYVRDFYTGTMFEKQMKTLAEYIKLM